MFSDRLKEIRKLHNITQEQLAAVLGMSRQTIAKYESGERFPDEVTLVRIADYFNTSLDYLLDRNNTDAEKIATLISHELKKRGLLNTDSDPKLASIINIIETLIIEFEKLNIK